MDIYDLSKKREYLREVATLEFDEWADNKTLDREKRIDRKIKRIEDNFDSPSFCKLILLDNSKLIGFISIFPNDSKECKSLTPWYSTMYVKKEYRGRGYSRLLNNAILEEAKKRGFRALYLKTDLQGYYERFGAVFIKYLNTGEKLLKFEL